jgi:NhaA family Na+:H+ antiporter
VNDGLMTVFFLVVGMEIKRELVVGELRDVRVAALPMIAAVGGMAGPAAIYLAINAGRPSVGGWAIPMATDIAFVLGALALLGRRAPRGLTIFVLTLAIVDDVGAIAVIALVYSQGIRWLWLVLGLAGTSAIWGLRRRQVVSPVAYMVAGIAVWFCAFRSGIHPTIAGAALGLLVPARPLRGRSVLEELQNMLHPVSSFFVVPIFALANAGVLVTHDSLSIALGSPVFWGIVVGLVAGKALGIFGASSAAEASRLGRRPSGMTRTHLVGGAALSGIGFTVSLFISDLAFDDPELIDVAKLSILVASTIAAVIGSLVLAAAPLKRSRRRGDSR